MLTSRTGRADFVERSVSAAVVPAVDDGDDVAKHTLDRETHREAVF